jgi:membrane protein involved in colicin uptake
VPQVKGTDPALEAKKKQAEDAEAAKKKAEEARVAAARAENCTRSKQAKASFDSGIRIARTTAQGEREVLDDAARASETKRLQDIIASDCR